MKTYAAYGVIDKDGVLDIRTVSPTIRAAKVNALYLGGVMVFNNNSAIDAGFDKLGERDGVKLVTLKIEVVGLTEPKEEPADA